jgi:hypothetical protein
MPMARVATLERCANKSIMRLCGARGPCYRRMSSWCGNQAVFEPSIWYCACLD